jgi:hypothetical protein
MNHDRSIRVSATIAVSMGDNRIIIRGWDIPVNTVIDISPCLSTNHRHDYDQSAVSKLIPYRVKRFDIQRLDDPGPDGYILS